MTAGDGIQSVLILRQRLKMQSKALPGHAMSKEWTQSNARDSTVCDDLQDARCATLRGWDCVRILVISVKTNETQVVIGKRMTNVRIYLHTPQQKARAEKEPKKISAKIIIIKKNNNRKSSFNVFLFFKLFFLISTHNYIPFFCFFFLVFSLFYKVFINTFQAGV